MVDMARKILFYDKTRFAVTVMGVAFAVTLESSSRSGIVQKWRG